MEKRIERIDLERVGATGIFVRKWYAGYNTDDAGAPDMEDYLQQGSIQFILAEYEKEGSTVEMASLGKGRALRGPIVRVDILFNGEKWILSKYPKGWTARTRPIESKIVTDVECEAAITWLKLKEWTLIQWEGGYRAFKGEAKPVRDRAAILALRRKFQEQHVNYRYDLALYF